MTQKQIAAHARSYDLITSWLRALDPQQSEDMCDYLDHSECVISKMIEVIAPQCPSYKTDDCSTPAYRVTIKFVGNAGSNPAAPASGQDTE